MRLPVHDVLPDLMAALSAAPRAVLVAPPGAGKTTSVPGALLDAPWRGDGRIVVLAPRRLAARSAAARVAALLGEPVGGLVGYSVRLESRTSARTRIEFVTEGVFVRRLLSQPDLEGIAAVVFDEVHERSLDGDLALALALDVQAGLRPELRLLAMSATLDGARVSALMQGAPVIESAGRMFPVETLYRPADALAPVETQVARAVREALALTAGDVLAFLPGVREITRVADALATFGDGVQVLPLHGGLEPAEQDAAVAPAPPGRRKVVLATAIAETSLTLPGVTAVVDSGLARRPVFEPDTGLTRLVTVRASRAATEQRRGRAGRTGPGLCLRLWSAGETGAFEPFDPPEILAADLSGLALALADWGVQDPAALGWLDPPPAPAWSEACALLTRLGALDDAGRLTAHGRAIAGLPLAPRLAHMVLGAERDFAAGSSAAHLAAVLSERGLGGPGADVAVRMGRFLTERGARAEAARAQARGWARAAGAAGNARPDPADAGLCLALAFPERVARARDRTGGFLMAGGRGCEIDPGDPLAAQPWLAVGEVQGRAAAARILAAAPLSAGDVDRLVAGQGSMRVEQAWDPAARAVRARRTRRLGAIVLESVPVPLVPGPAVMEALAAAVRQHGLSLLDWTPHARAVRARLAFLHRGDREGWPDVSDSALIEMLDRWLAPALDPAGRLDRTDPAAALLDSLDWNARQALDALAPSRFVTPAGAGHALDYEADPGPALEVRVQELFGLETHPVVGRQKAPLVLRLTSPAHRPIAVTSDLPGFWRGAWSDVRKDMKARYPKHLWPERPWEAQATTRARPRGT